MIKDNQKNFNRLQVLLDALVIMISYLIGWRVMLSSAIEDRKGVLPFEFYMMALVFLVPFFLLL